MGTFIIEYVGEVISTDMCQDRYSQLAKVVIFQMLTVVKNETI